MLRRVIVVAGAFSLVTAACGGGSVLAPPPTTGTVQATESSVTDPSVGDPSATESSVVEPSSSQPVESSVTTGTTPPAPAPAPAPDLAVHQVMLRYEGAAGAGTFEATICNLGEAVDPGPEVTITANGVQATVRGGTMDPMSCDDLSDPMLDLSSYGVAGPGRVTVTVEVGGIGGDPPGNNTLAVDLDIAEVTASAPSDQLQRYRDCLARGNDHRNCVIEVPYHPIADAGEVMKVSNGYLVIGPARYSEVLSYLLADNALCTPRLEEWLGIDGPTPVSHRLVVTDDYSGGYAVPFVQVYSVGSGVGWDEFAADEGPWRQPHLEGICSNAHELTHLILGEVPMPGWLNEGLATYMQDSGRSGYGRSQPVECREHGWYGRDFDGVVREVPFQDLMIYDPDVHGIYYYYTAMCFWEYLEDQYGTGAIQEILRETAAYRDPGFNGCTSMRMSVLFIDDIVNPVLGTDISPVTLDKWGFGGTYTSCEGL